MKLPPPPPPPRDCLVTEVSSSAQFKSTRTPPPGTSVGKKGDHVTLLSLSAVPAIWALQMMASMMYTNVYCDVKAPQDSAHVN